MAREAANALKMNDIAHVRLKVQLPLVCDDYADNRTPDASLSLMKAATTQWLPV